MNLFCVLLTFTEKPDNPISLDLRHVPQWGGRASPLVSTNGTVHHADAEHYKSLINNNRGTDTEHRDLQTPRYSEKEGVEKSSRLLIHITSTVHCSQKQTKKRLVALLKWKVLFMYRKLHQIAK